VTIFSVTAAFVVGLVVAAGTTPLVARLASRLEVVDRPNERTVNRRPHVPLMGGLAVALGFFAALAVTTALSTFPAGGGGHPHGLLLGGILLLVVGAFDDRWSLKAREKLLLEVVAAAIAILYGFRVDHVTDPVSRTVIWFPEWVVWLATTLWIVGITNALNLLDGLDGLATGVAAIIGGTLVVICWQAGQPLGVILGAGFVGALLGFLPYNFSPARIFLGDTGALFIGYTLALLALEGYRKVSVLTFVVPLLVMAVPIMDTGLSILRRLRRRNNIFSADRLHMHHRLLETEGSQRSAVLSIYFLTGCFSVIAVSFTRLRGYAAILFLLAVIALTIRLLRNLGFVEPRESASAGHEAAVGGEGRGR
jgi:UDP-GlcNAc:undecaprenyl-phosphate GlcNAc-1-phosphate transferase